MSNFGAKKNSKYKKMAFNVSNPTDGWTDDEKYKFCKVENKWLKVRDFGRNFRQQ